MSLSSFSTVVNKIKDGIKGTYIHLGIGDINIYGEHSTFQDENQTKNDDTRDDNLFVTVDELRTELLRNKTKSNNRDKVTDVWNLFQSKLDSIKFDSENFDRQKMTKLYNEIKQLTKQFLDVDEINFACLSLRFEHKFIKALYSGRSQLKELVEIGISMQNIAKKMSQQKTESQFLNELELMNEVVQDMQEMSRKNVDLITKFNLLAGFCIAYSGCCLETKHNNLAKEVTQKVIFLMETVYHDYDSVSHHSMDAVLNSCYYNLGIALHRLREDEAANIAFAKAEHFNSKITTRNEKRVASNRPPLPLDSAEKLVLSITQF